MKSVWALTMTTPSAEGIEVPGNLPTPLETLLDWTNQVSALKIAAALFPDLEAVVDNTAIRAFT